jgi:hypothetical protein
MKRSFWPKLAAPRGSVDVPSKPAGRSRFFLAVEHQPIQTDQGSVSLVVGTVSTSAELPAQISRTTLHIGDQAKA